MKRILLSLLFAVVIFSSCSVLDRNASIYYNEKELSLNDIADMRHDFSQNEETEKNVTLIPYDEVLSDDLVYWVSGGSVWHKTYNCGYIKSGSEVFCGTKESAAENGKTSVCSACEK